MKRTVPLIVALAATAAAFTTATAAPQHAAVGATPLNPAQFSHPRANPYFPLKPGTATVLRGSADGERFRDHVLVTHRTKMIQGVRAQVIIDVTRRSSDGSVSEKTTDWYAGDNDGNVWYLGENTATYDKSGHVESREGSWQAGVDGAVAGVIMPADPVPTDAYRQEYYAGHAEDQAWIVSRLATARVPLGRFDHVVRSFEWTRLESDVVSQKLYARGVGIIAERDVAGGDELFEVVSVRHR